MNKPALELRKLVRCIDAISARLNPGLLAVVAVLSVGVLAAAVRRVPLLYIQEVAAGGLQLTNEPPAVVSPDQPAASE